jgi:hypothetical protein
MEYWSIDVLKYWGIERIQKRVTRTPCGFTLFIIPSLHYSITPSQVP